MKLSRGKKIRILSGALAALAVLLAAAIFGNAPGNGPRNESGITRFPAGQTVKRVIDGDTIVLEGGQIIRLLGIDADEKGQPCWGEAKARLEELVLNKKVGLEASDADTDRYGRYLRYVFAGSENTSVTLAREGLVAADFYPDNRKYREEIAAAVSGAKKKKTGCKWSAVPRIE